MKLAHLSDLHFSNWDWKLSQFFSKRWLGNLNYLLRRRNTFVHERLGHLPSLFKELGITHVLITGDLTTTSSPAEFEKAQEFVQSLGIEVFCIPGNHDQYTTEAHRSQRFYNYFSDRFDNDSPYNLKDHGMTVKELSPEWSLVALDTALATPYFFSTGRFSEVAEKNLTEYLSNLPSHKQVLLVNHFPFFEHENYRKRLERGNVLRKILEQFPQVKLYCHGHTHRQCVADLRASQLPIIIDSGSTIHRELGSWHALELKANHISTEIYSWKDDQWQPSFKETYELV